jgi:hypothetical protein
MKSSSGREPVVRNRDLHILYVGKVCTKKIVRSIIVHIKEHYPSIEITMSTQLQTSYR